MLKVTAVVFAAITLLTSAAWACPPGWATSCYYVGTVPICQCVK